VRPARGADAPLTRAGSAGSKGGNGGDDLGAQEGRKLFIAGVAYETQDFSLRAYFEKFGEVEEAMIMRDKLTQRSRGFGFVTFRSREPVDRVMSTKLDDLRPGLVPLLVVAQSVLTRLVPLLT
jgi:hypothetical protein